MEEPAEEAATTILPEEPEAMAEAEEEPAATPRTATEATAEKVALTAAAVAAEVLTTRTMARQDPVGQKAPTEALAVQVGSISDRTEKPEAPARTPSEKDWTLKALAPEALPPPSMVAEVAVVATAESEAQADPEVLPEAAVAEATAESEAQAAPPM